MEKQPTEATTEKLKAYPIGPIDEETAAKRAATYVVFFYGLGCTGQRRPVLENGKFVSIVVYHCHGYGDVGDIGRVEIDAQTGQVTYATPVAEVDAACAKLYAEHGEAIEAAWKAYQELCKEMPVRDDV